MPGSKSMTVNFSSPTFPFHLPKLFGKECQLSAQPIQGYKLPASEIEKKKEKEKNTTCYSEYFETSSWNEAWLYFILWLEWTKVKQSSEGKSVFIF